jgi:hypothetical protein
VIVFTPVWYGLVQYLEYLLPGMTWVEIHAISLAVVAVASIALYRRVTETGAISLVLWGIALGQFADRDRRLVDALSCSSRVHVSP